MLRNKNETRSFVYYLTVLVLVCMSIEPNEASKNVSRNVRIDKLSNCKAKLDDGQIIDLSQLDNANNPM
jgi:hypothetical protein